MKRLALLLAEGRARYVHGHVAAADHNDFAPYREAVTQVDVQQEVGASDDAVEVAAGELQVAAATQSDGQQNGLKPLLPQVGQGEIAQPTVEAELGPEVQDLADLGLHHVAGKAVFRNAQVEHPARRGRCFENRHGIPEQSQVVGRAKPGRARADHRDALFMSHLGLFRKHF